MLLTIPSSTHYMHRNGSLNPVITPVIIAAVCKTASRQSCTTVLIYQRRKHCTVKHGIIIPRPFIGGCVIETIPLKYRSLIYTTGCVWTLFEENFRNRE